MLQTSLCEHHFQLTSAWISRSYLLLYQITLSFLRTSKLILTFILLDFADSFSIVDGGSSQQQVAAPKNPLMATIAESNNVCRSLPHSPSSPLLTTTRSETTTTTEELTIENSLIGSRVPLIPRSISGMVPANGFRGILQRAFTLRPPLSAQYGTGYPVKKVLKNMLCSKYST